ncbi:MAG: hypothetical protein WA064_03905 [Candidatus Moraniibacteriota bacterium]
MHQTFYIDIDEEITSIVEKLRKTEAPEVIMVVPKRALLIQSIVNLKLLRKVAEELGLKISIVTQDKLGKMLVNKAGIAVQQKLEDDPEELEATSDNGENGKKVVLEDGAEGEPASLLNSKQNRRLDRIGSAEYFNYNNEENIHTELEQIEKPKKPLAQKVPIYVEKNRPSVENPLSGIRLDEEIPVVKKRSPSMDVSRSNMRKPIPTRVVREKTVFPEEKQGESSRDEQLEQFFYANNFADRKKSDSLGEERSKKNVGTGLKILAIILAIALTGGLAYGAYLYVPKAIITLSAKKEVKSTEANITATTNQESIDLEKSIIPAKVLDFDDTVSQTFVATGEKSVSDQKAKGKITIYNEFSSLPQPLVATTRFISEDQKIFRLVQSVTIPGTTKVGTEIKPGVTEAEVIADESGDGYNIPAANFSIPGFKDSGSEKYAKIYAKSTAAMTGGGTGGSTVKMITDKDLADAKDKISLEITDAIKQKVKDSVGSGQVVLDKAISLEEPVYTLSGAVGDIVDNFEIKVQAKAKAIVFLESDLKKLANTIIVKTKNSKVNLNDGALIIDYGQVNADFSANTLDIAIKASSVTEPNFDLEAMKKGFLGKDTEALTDYLKSYPNIEKAEVEYWPPVFVNKVPMQEKRVEVILDYIMP